MMSEAIGHLKRGCQRRAAVSDTLCIQGTKRPRLGNIPLSKSTITRFPMKFGSLKSIPKQRYSQESMAQLIKRHQTRVMALAFSRCQHTKFEFWPHQLKKSINSLVRGKAVNFDCYPLIDGLEADSAFAAILLLDFLISLSSSVT